MGLIPREIAERYAGVKPAYRRAYQTLRAAVLEGRFNTSSRCTENDLSEELGMSRTPVRRALDLLDSEGITLSFAQHDRDLDPNEKADILVLLAQLEGQAARQAAINASEEWVDLLEEVNENMKRYTPGKDSLDALRDLDLQFHLLVARGSQNDFLYDEIKRIRMIMRERQSRRTPLSQDRHLFQTQLYDRLIEAFRLNEPFIAESWARSSVFSTLWLFKLATLS